VAATDRRGDRQGWAALERAKQLIDEDDMAPAMGLLGVAAHADVAEAQFLLGTLLLNDEGEEDEEQDAEGEQEQEQEARALVRDAEHNRQRSNHPDDAKDLREIRKSARRAYKQHLQAEAAKKKAGSGSAGDKDKKAVVNHATVKQLDRTFGVTLRELLDPNTELPPLQAEAEGEDASRKADSTKAVEWIRRAADNSHWDAHVVLGNLCQSHDPPLALTASAWYLRVADPRAAGQSSSHRAPAPHPDALYNLGLMLFEGVEHADPPFPANRTASIAYFVKAAEAGDAAAQLFMGQLLHQGDEELGITPNLDSALMLLERAAKAEHSGALYYLAQLYRSGSEDGALQANRDKFLEYLDTALELHDEDALFCMADMYFHGSDGFDKDLEQARHFYEAAAERGSADAFLCLGAIYYNGIGVQRDYERAFLYYQEAAERDSLAAWKNLADMYAVGRGIPRNEDTARAILKMIKKVEQQEGEVEEEGEKQS
jgi:TPR repeat protein